jgi:hypothetical protein
MRETIITGVAGLTGAAIGAAISSLVCWLIIRRAIRFRVTKEIISTLDEIFAVFKVTLAGGSRNNDTTANSGTDHRS